jgi:hypothetical protein
LRNFLAALQESFSREKSIEIEEKVEHVALPYGPVDVECGEAYSIPAGLSRPRTMLKQAGLRIALKRLSNTCVRKLCKASAAFAGSDSQANGEHAAHNFSSIPQMNTGVYK